jgi:hypothetical protein
MDGGHVTERSACIIVNEAAGAVKLQLRSVWPGVYPAEMRSTRDLMRRRLYFTRQRAELLTHIRNTYHQYNLTLPEGQQLDTAKNRAGLAKPFADASARKSVEADLILCAKYDDLIKDLEKTIVRQARVHNRPMLELLQTMRGVGQILGSC